MQMWLDDDSQLYPPPQGGIKRAFTLYRLFALHRWRNFELQGNFFPLIDFELWFRVGGSWGRAVGGGPT